MLVGLHPYRLNIHGIGRARAAGSRRKAPPCDPS